VIIPQLKGNMLTRSNLMKFSKTHLLRAILYFLIAGIVVFYFNQNNVTYPQVNLSLQTARPELIQIFCDAGNGYNEALSSAVTTSPAQQKGEPISLTLPSVCKHLRLDLGSLGATVKISSATLITIRGDKVDILDRILSPPYRNELKASESNHGELAATGNDPWVLLSGEFSELTTVGYSLVAILKMLIIFVIVFGVVAVSDFWVNKD